MGERAGERPPSRAPDPKKYVYHDHQSKVDLPPPQRGWAGGAQHVEGYAQPGRGAGAGRAGTEGGVCRRPGGGGKQPLPGPRRLADYA